MRHGLTLAVIGTLLATSPVQAQVLLSDNFDSETLGVPSLGMTNWDITGTVDVVASGAYGFPCAGGSGRCVDLDGTGTMPGPRQITTKSSYAFLAGDRMRLSFSVSGNQRNSAFDSFIMRYLFSSPTNLASIEGTGVFDFVSAGPVVGNLAYLVSRSIAGTAGFTESSIEFVAGTAGSVKFELGTSSTDNIGPILDDVVIERFAATVPEPSSVALLGLGLFGLVASRRRRLP